MTTLDTKPVSPETPPGSRRAQRLAHSLTLGMPGALLASTIAIGLATPAATANDKDGGVPFETADLFFELNDTDGDLGFQAFIDGEAWRKLEIEGPNEVKILDLFTKSALRKQGLTEFFFESSEPPFDQLPPEAFFARFPEGRYEIGGITTDGRELASADVVSHVLPAPVGGLAVSGVEPTDDCETTPYPAVLEPLNIAWEKVTTSHPTIGRTAPVHIVGYSVILERLTPRPLKYTAELGAGANRLTIPAGVTGPGDTFQLEIQAREASGNLTIVQRCFAIAR